MMNGLIAKAIEKENHQATVRNIKEKLPDLNNAKFIFVGAPTRMGRMGRRVKLVLKAIKSRKYVENPIVIFDTHIPLPKDPKEMEKSKAWIEPGAAGRMYDFAKKLGLNVYPKLLRCEVQGLKGPLGAQEVDKATTFTQEFISSIK